MGILLKKNVKKLEKLKAQLQKVEQELSAIREAEDSRLNEKGEFTPQGYWLNIAVNYLDTSYLTSQIMYIDATIAADTKQVYKV